LRRVGAKKQPIYRIVVADAQAPRDGRFIESIGQYNPRTSPETVVVDEGRALHWLNVGAQPSESVTQLFTKRGTLDRFQRMRRGEPMETLLAEAGQANAAAQAISPHTRQEGSLAGKKKAKTETAAPTPAE
jgi:small subunit ribosomal protein S16